MSTFSAAPEPAHRNRGLCWNMKLKAAVVLVRVGGVTMTGPTVVLLTLYHHHHHQSHHLPTWSLLRRRGRIEHAARLYHARLKN